MPFITTTGVLVATVLQQGVPATRPSWVADPARIAEMEKIVPGFNYHEEGVPAYVLPEVLRTSGGGRVTTAEGWEKARRAETLELFAHHVYGKSPGAPARVTFEVAATTPDVLGGKGTLKRVRITSFDAAGKSFAFEASVVTPNGVAGKVPAFLLINNRSAAIADLAKESPFWSAGEIVSHGYAAVIFRTGDVDADDPKPESRERGVRGAWPHGGGTAEGGDEWGTIAAWAWGASRVLDYLVTDPAIDGTKVAVVGHSRGGKTALWASAQDPRFWLTVSNDSGEVGAAIARRKFGETTARINSGFPHWFCANFKGFDDREESLPVDQHQLLALMAPRPLYVASAGGDLWSDPRGEFLSLAAASEAYGLYGQARVSPEEMPALDAPIRKGLLAYHIRTGQHDLTAYDWRQFIAFADGLRGVPPR